MKRSITLIILSCVCLIAFCGRNDVDKWRVMVHDLEVFASPSPDAEIIGHYKRFDCPEISGVRSKKMISVNYNGQKGYVFEDGLLGPKYMPGSTIFHEKSVEDAKVIQANGGRIPDGYNLKAMYDIWDNDNEDLPVMDDDIEMEEAEIVDEDPCDSGYYKFYESEGATWQTILMIIIIGGSILSLISSIFKFRWTGILLISIPVIELLYLLLSPDPIYFSRYKEFDDGTVRRLITSDWPFIVAILQILAVTVQLRSRNLSTMMRIIPTLLLLLVFGTFLIEFGIGDFFHQLLRATVKLVMSIIGLSITGVLIYAFFKDGIDSPGRSSSSDGGARNRDACCHNCIHYAGSDKRCTRTNSYHESGDVCNGHIWG